ncbi:hypothetical protein MKW94_001391, partial [Papaver nudicaule]|nr:hypothetical protein [Papaver nudicaule]
TFAGNIGHDPHMLYTLSAVQVRHCRTSFAGDIWGEIDTRFMPSLLHRLDKINLEKDVEYVVRCKNLDGDFGCTPAGESHAGRLSSVILGCCNCLPFFYSVGALAITGSLRHFDKDLFGWWLSERQVKSGGLYSWRVIPNLIMIDSMYWIDKDKFAKFILDCKKTLLPYWGLGLSGSRYLAFRCLLWNWY